MFAEPQSWMPNVQMDLMSSLYVNSFMDSNIFLDINKIYEKKDCYLWKEFCFYVLKTIVDNI